MKINKFNSLNSRTKYFYMIEMRGDFDLKEMAFESFNDAMNYMNHNYEEKVQYYGEKYKVFKIKKELIDKDMFNMWQDSNKYNL